MRTARLILLGVILGLVQGSLHGLSSHWVVPNIVLASLVFAAGRFSFAELATLALSAGIVLESFSGAGFGVQLLAVVLLVLVYKLVLRASTDASRLGFQIVLAVVSTVVIGLAVALSVSVAVLSDGWGTVVLRIGLESLYNGLIVLVLTGFWQPRQATGSYRLPAQMK